MALFKISRGGYENLPEGKTDGWAYFTPGNKGFYIDVVDNIAGTEYSSRIKINDRVSLTQTTIRASDWVSNVCYIYLDISDNAEDGTDFLYEIAPNLSGGIQDQFDITSKMSRANISYTFDKNYGRLTLIASGTQPDIDLPITIKRIPKEVAYVF